MNPRFVQTPTLDDIRDAYIASLQGVVNGERAAFLFQEWYAQEYVDIVQKATRPIYLENIQGTPSAEWLRERDAAVWEKAFEFFSDYFAIPVKDSSNPYIKKVETDV